MAGPVCQCNAAQEQVDWRGEQTVIDRLAERPGEPTPRMRLWREEGVRVLPGAYMGREIEPGKTQSNPGFSYVRVALVSDLSTIMTALERVRKILDS